MVSPRGRALERRRAVVLGLSASLLAATAALAPVGATAQPVAQPVAQVAEQTAAPARTATVMTRNLYLGAELGPIIGALATGNGALILAAATQTWAAVRATRPAERLAAIADEIVAADPAVVGLQEVTTWRTFTYDYPSRTASDPVVVYDFLDLLLDALADRGVDYREVQGATARNFTSPAIPIATGPGLPTTAVGLADRDVILARDDVRVTNARNGNFQTIVRFPIGGGVVLPVARGWGSADVEVGRATFRFVNSHLEAFALPGQDAEQIRVAQAGELLAAQDAIAVQVGDLPVVYVGDYNSRAPDAAAYRRLLTAVGHDAWTRTHRNDAGATCCFDAEVDDPTARLSTRIDLVLHSDDVKAPRATIVGDEVEDMTASGLWPSDHAGVVARLVFPAGR